MGEEPDNPWVLSSAPRHAHLDGFDLHADVAVPAGDRARLEGLCRYLLRPAVAQERLRLMHDGRILLTLKTAWADGTRHLLFEPVELLEKLAALIPRPRINLVLYHGVLAPHARWRARVVACGVSATVSPARPRGLDEPSEGATRPLRPRHWAWASLMRRAFDVDVLACPRCGGRLRLVVLGVATPAVQPAGAQQSPECYRIIIERGARAEARLNRMASGRFEQSAADRLLDLELEREYRRLCASRAPVSTPPSAPPATPPLRPQPSSPPGHSGGLAWRNLTGRLPAQYQCDQPPSQHECGLAYHGDADHECRWCGATCSQM